jgi:threonine dehydrogenase-like Zn-dependent dehydrogenase
MAKELRVADSVVLNKTTENLMEAVNAMTHGRGADVIITATSSPTAQMRALKIAKQGGVVSKEIAEIPTKSSL